MIQKLADKTYKITYLNYPRFASMFIVPNGDVLLQNGVMKQHKFNIKDIDAHESNIRISIGEELFIKVKKIAEEYK